mmetsp:Transcript_3180/g.9215  ORF Transcript_3180/g.9215 Transcript_3180/m.9215 type:complete len:341 (-) Transcript_3180:660-1682(-)
MSDDDLSSGPGQGVRSPTRTSLPPPQWPHLHQVADSNGGGYEPSLTELTDAHESAGPEQTGAAAPTEVLVALLGDVKQDLDRVHWVLAIPSALLVSGLAAGVSTLTSLWPGLNACKPGGAEQRMFGYQAGAYCAAFGCFAALLLRVVYAVTRDLLALEGVAREFRVQLAALLDAVEPGPPEGHPYSRRDLHHLYSTHSKSLFLVIYVLAALVGGGGTPLFLLGAFCPSGPQLSLWGARAFSLAAAATAYLLPLFCFASGGFGLKPWFGPGIGVAPSGREHGRGSVTRESAQPADVARQLAAGAVGGRSGTAVGFALSSTAASTPGEVSGRGTPRAGPQRV